MATTNNDTLWSKSYELDRYDYFVGMRKSAVIDGNDQSLAKQSLAWNIRSMNECERMNWPGPFSVEPFEIFLTETELFLVVSLLEVLQQDGNVHINDDHGREDDERDQVERGQRRITAIAVRQILIIQITVGRLDQQCV